MDTNWVIKKSKIQGQGVFSTRWLPRSALIDVGIVYVYGIIPKVTFFGSKMNHSYDSNVDLLYSPKSKTWNVYAKKDIPKNTELLLDYNDTPSFIQGPKKEWGSIPQNYSIKDKSL